MALVLNATPGATDANSYPTLADANAYHEGRLHTSDWTSATDANKEAGLVWATRIIDTGYVWNGSKYSNVQSLEWPRFGVENSSVVPVRLKDSVSEFAMLLIREDRTEDLTPTELTSVVAGSIKVDMKTAKASLIPAHVDSMLVGLYCHKDGGMSVILVRT